MSHANPVGPCPLQPLNSGTLQPLSFRRVRVSAFPSFGVSLRPFVPALLFAAWMTVIPRVAFAQECPQWADRTPLGTARPSTGAFSAQTLATKEETE